MFINTANRHAPIKKYRVKGIETPWMTSDLSSAMQDRDYHHRKATKTNSSHHWKLYKKLKIYINKVVKKCKAECYQDLINKNKGISRELWKTLNKVTSRKSSPPPSSIEDNGVSLTDPKSIAETINTHFSVIGTKLAAAIRVDLCPRRSGSQSNGTVVVANKFNCQQVDETFVRKQLRDLKTNKAVGLDKISAKMLKDSAYVSAPVLTKLFNRSLRSSTFPNILKSGKVLALFKSGDHSYPNNYRPITILSTVSKIL